MGSLKCLRVTLKIGQHLTSRYGDGGLRYKTKKLMLVFHLKMSDGNTAGEIVAGQVDHMIGPCAPPCMGPLT